ncbi:SGNH/GDSL hydrolase family protein [Bhargavaea cecembensis]|uniref:SGNH/GDSL hydrolase family protein n=1 Tax=Bhargavaea cecembensis TaxID=394098 RepID=UPI0008410613|nr:GDSL-type esterase/lipase family protein [Bhargavaea cecembensis]
MKKLAAAMLALFLFLPPATNAQAAGPVVYVALGDSLAAGQTPHRAIDAGYADLIALKLKRYAGLAFYSKDLSFPGFTTTQVLDRVRSEEAQDLLGRANLITISAGANDLLGLIRHDAANGTLAFDQIPADYALNSVRKNMASILAELKMRAPRANVYVMGYYFPYPHVRKEMKAGTRRQLDRLNAILKRESEAAGAIFVPVADRFEGQAAQLIPNPADVHPSMEGYRRMANAFFDASPYRMNVLGWEVPQPAPISFEELSRQTEDRSAGTGRQASAERPSDDPRYSKAAGVHAILPETSGDPEVFLCLDVDKRAGGVPSNRTNAPLKILRTRTLPRNRLTRL